MYTARAHIADHRTQVLAKLALDREVPLHDVIPAWVGIEICLTKVIGRADVCKRRARKRPCGQASGASRLIERRRKEFVELYEIGEWQNIEHPESRTNRGLATAERVPGHSHSRLEIAPRGVGK